MVWFVCDDCGDSIKKPKVPQHLQQCSASRFTCLDCSRSFDRHTVKGHATCVTEVDKYAKGATKPGGYAAQGYYKDGSGATIAVTQPVASTSEPADTAYLATRPPWTCSVCKVTCTSQDTLLGHAAGVKHRRRARAAAKEEKGADAAQPSQSNPSQPEPVAVAVVSVDVIPVAEVTTKRAAGAAADEAPHKVKKQKLNTAQPGTTETATGQDAAELENVPALSQKQLDQIKWKKLAVQVLKNSKDSSMKLSKLQKQLRLAAQVSDALTAAANASIESRLKGSTQFVMKGSLVCLAASA